MNIDFDKARQVMIDNQLRPNKIVDNKILNSFKNVKKENFLSSSINKTSYYDSNINISQNRGYLKNLHIAQLINSANISKEHKVLHIGGLTGYVSAILSNFCKKLIVIENETTLIEKIKNNINNMNISNIKVVKSKFDQGYFEESPYDVIFIDNPINEISDSVKFQLKSNLAKIIMIKKIKGDLNKAYKIIKNNDYFSEEYLFDVFSNYILFKKESRFEF